MTMAYSDARQSCLSFKYLA